MFLKKKNSSIEATKEDKMKNYLPIRFFRKQFDVLLVSEARVYGPAPMTIEANETPKQFAERINKIFARLLERDFYSMKAKLYYSVITYGDITLRLYPNGSIERYDSYIGLV